LLHLPTGFADQRAGKIDKMSNYPDANGTGIVKTAQTGRFQAKKKRPPCTKHSGRGGQIDTNVDLSQGLLHCKQACSERVNVIVFDQFFDTGIEFLDNSLDLSFLLSDYVSIATCHLSIDFLDLIK